jgi:hypothetical protein
MDFTFVSPFKKNTRPVIGIFGDSFAVDFLDKNSPYYDTGWPKRLGDEYVVTNYAVSGTSLFWTYTQLLKYMNDCDIVVLVITYPGRLYHPDPYLNIGTLPTTLEQKKKYLKRGTLPTTLEQKKHSIERLTILTAAENYYINLSQPEFDLFVHDKIVDEIQSQCNSNNKKLVLIPGFPENVKYQSVFRHSLYDIMMKEIYVTFGDFEFRQETPSRLNHMSLRNNEILAELICKIINNTCHSVTLDDFVFEKEPHPEQFWKL